MFVEERKEKILSLLKNQSKVTVNELSELFKISKVIVRKDLQALENEGVITRTHGGAILKRQFISNIFLKDFEKKDFDDKLIIAEKIVNLLEDGDIIFLDDSTVTLIVASILQKSKLSLTIITNMLKIQNTLIDNENIKLISLGGEYDKRTDSFIGDLARENLKKFNFTKSFIGIGGINLNRMCLSTPNLTEGVFKKTALSLSSKTYIIAQTNKFFQDCIYNFTSLNESITLITDNKLPDDILKEISDSNLTIV